MINVIFLCVFQLEEKVQQGERDFEQISKTIRKEVSRFEVRRFLSYITICSPSGNTKQLRAYKKLHIEPLSALPLDN